jgi:hypothetical protein
MCPAESADKPRLSVIEGGTDVRPRIALSLVHPRERIDIPVKDLLEVEALAEETFFVPEIKAFKTYEFAHVRLDLRAEICGRIYRLTSRIIDEPLDIVVAGEAICSPIVREPLWSGLRIHLFDFAEAKAIAAKIRKGWVIPDLRIVQDSP